MKSLHLVASFFLSACSFFLFFSPPINHLSDKNSPLLTVVNNCPPESQTLSLAMSHFRSKSFKMSALSTQCRQISHPRLLLLSVSLLFLSGDLELNPGPRSSMRSRSSKKPLFPCGDCSGECVSNCICCDGCDTMYRTRRSKCTRRRTH